MTRHVIGGKRSSRRTPYSRIVVDFARHVDLQADPFSGRHTHAGQPLTFNCVGPTPLLHESF